MVASNPSPFCFWKCLIAPRTFDESQALHHFLHFSLSLRYLFTRSRSTVLVDVDHRTSVSLNGDWHFIVDPYATGLYTFHHELREDGFYLNGAAEPGSDHLVEYDFAKSPTLKVPGDWNTQSAQLFYYEGLVWYQRYFDFQPQAHHRTFLHIGAANYKALIWINGQHVCDHEGGFTAFDCEATQQLHAGRNFIVVAVDDDEAGRRSSHGTRLIGSTTEASPAM